MFNRRTGDSVRSVIDRRREAAREGRHASPWWQKWKALPAVARIAIVVGLTVIVAFLVGHALDLAGVEATLQVPRGEGG